MRRVIKIAIESFAVIATLVLFGIPLSYVVITAR
jgi:hypothetical protein